MRTMAFIRAMKWKSLIITFILTSILGVVLTIYSCKPANSTYVSTNKEELAVRKEPAEPICTAASCVQ